MEFNSNNSWCTGLYGKAVPEIWNFICNNGRYQLRYSHFKKESLTTMGDGSVIFHGNNQYYNRDFANKGYFKSYRRGMYNFILFCLNIYFENLHYSLSREKAYLLPGKDTSLAKLREFSTSELGKEIKISNMFTLEDIVLFAEYILGDKEKKNLLKHYSKEAIDNIIGKPADPLTAGVIDTILQKIEELKIDKSNEVKAVVEKYNLERKQVEDAWDIKIKELENQIEEVKKMNVMRETV